MQILSFGDNLHAMPMSIFWIKQVNYFKMSSAESFIQYAKR